MRRRRRRTGVLATVLIGAGVAVIVVTLRTSQAPRALPHPFAATPATTATGSPRTQQPTTRGPAVPTASAPGVGTGSGPPVRVVITRLHIDGRVRPVLSSDGQIDVPVDPAQLGWWAVGAAPGSAVGSTVIVGHVDSARSGPGTLFHLDRVRRADRIDVGIAGGKRIAYRVDSLTDVKKTTGLRASLFDAAGPPKLVLITCGGPFDEATRSYRDNIVVTAHPT
ncbi:class F sortase [uncultured Jatrophihabitans sp.]|uniref:class F sortase n=1 Tax=uncultured Jatrophihabitans sp. TaxID=1610747 RepID=UPI0035CBD69F